MTTALPATKFLDIVTHVKLAQCASCDTHEYRVPFPITEGIQDFLSCFGALKFPLDKVRIIKIENEHVLISGRVGLPVIKIKLKKDPKQRHLFEVQLAAYISKEMNVIVDV